MSRKAKRACGQLLELLEPRQLLSISLPGGGIPGTALLEGTSGNDAFVVRMQPGTTANMQFSDDGGTTFQTTDTADVEAVQVIANGGNDTLTIDNSFGFVTQAFLGENISFDGGTGVSTLIISGTPGSTTLSATYTAGAAGAGTLATTDSSTTEAITFINLSAIMQSSPLLSLSVNLATGNKVVRVQAGQPFGTVPTVEISGNSASGLLTSSATEGRIGLSDGATSTVVPITVANALSVSVDTGTGDAFAAVNLPTAAAGLGALSITGGTGNNVLGLAALSGAVRFTNANFAREDTTADELVVDSLFQQILQRQADPASLNFWAGVAQTSGTAAVVAGIAASTEVHDNQIKALYETYLGRAALNGEEFFWVNELNAGISVENVLDGILASNEFGTHAMALAGTVEAPDEAFVQAMFQLLLGRTASEQDVFTFEGQLPQAGRAGVAAELLFSAEFRTDIVTSFYSNLLNRQPDAGGLTSWVDSGIDLMRIRLEFLNSPEFINGA